MESRTFHPFPRLPKELRDIIWALAIRPHQPSAHFFTVFNSSNDAEWLELSQYAMWHNLVSRCSLAAPHGQTPDHQRQFSWVRGNRSVYMIDRGLWTACWESREVIERRFRTGDWDKKRDEMFMADLSRAEHRKNFPVAPATTFFRSSDEWHRSVVHPRSDLFHLRPFIARTVDWDLDRPVPIFDNSEHYYVGNIALDFDPQWVADFNSLRTVYPSDTYSCAVRAATNQLEWTENLWLVDYRIRRRLDAPPTLITGKTFYGTRCKFTEVREGDMEWEIDHNKNIFRFLEQFLEDVDERCRDRQEDGYWGPRPYLGVLAYEEW